MTQKSSVTMGQRATMTSQWIAVADGREIYRGYSYSDAKDARRSSHALSVIIKREDQNVSPS